MYEGLNSKQNHKIHWLYADKAILRKPTNNKKIFRVLYAFETSSHLALEKCQYLYVIFVML